jgi:hypothetical protein
MMRSHRSFPAHGLSRVRNATFLSVRDIYNAFLRTEPSGRARIHKIRPRRAEGAMLAELARSYDVSKSTISRLTP